jgi:hypothetical protein
MLKWRAGHDTYGGYGDTPVTPRPTYDGAVLAVGGARDVRVMSDVWGTETFATVWDGEKITTVGTALSDDMGYRVYADAAVDATLDVRTAARAYTVRKEADRLKYEFDRATDRIVAFAAKIERGKTVIVARGRKVKKGTIGEVFWLGEGNYGLRAGIKDADGTVYWTAASNLDVIDPWDYIPEIPIPSTDAEYLARAEAIVPPFALLEAA